MDRQRHFPRRSKGPILRFRCRGQLNSKRCNDLVLFHRDNPKPKYCAKCWDRVRLKKKPGPKEPWDISSAQIEKRYQAAMMIKKRQRMMELAQEPAEPYWLK